LLVRVGADRWLVVAALAGGIMFDIAARSGLATIAATVWVAAVVAVLLTGGRARGWTGRLLLGIAPAFAALYALRSSPWVLAPVTGACVLLLVLGVSLGADGGGLATTFPGLGARVGLVFGHLALAPGMFGSHGGSGAVTRQRVAAVGIGALLSVPVMIIVGGLLAAADPIFRSWFDLSSILDHVALACIGAWAVIGLARAIHAKRPAAPLPSPPRLGVVEASCMLGGLSALYAAFVAAQFVALSAGGRHVLLTRGLTYAQYARSGFFELLWCAAITLLVLLGVRACASREHPALKGLSALTVVLTLCVVVIAIGRLRLYEAAYGLTLLRLACLVAAVWIGAVFLLLGATMLPRGLPPRAFPALVVVSGLLVIGAWGVANPASIVARVNLARAEDGHSLDVHEAVSLGPDAMPTLLASLGRLNPAQQQELRAQLCQQSPSGHSGTAFNLARATAASALARACGSGNVGRG
jgi:hypothetical protein